MYVIVVKGRTHLSYGAKSFAIAYDPFFYSILMAIFPTLLNLIEEYIIRYQIIGDIITSLVSKLQSCENLCPLESENIKISEKKWSSPFK